MRKPVTIVIVTYNSGKYVGECLAKLLPTLSPEDKVHVVDNASSDDTVRIVGGFAGEQIRLTVNTKNLGFTVANNQVLRACTTPYAVLLNADAFVSKGWIEQLQSHFTSDTIGAVGPITNFAANEQSLTYNSRLRLDPSVRARQTKLLLNFCAMYKMSVFDKIGYLDTNLFLGNDDLDFSLRMREHGYELVIALDTYVSHIGHHTFDSVDRPTLNRLFQESTDILYEKLRTRYAKVSGFELWGIDWFKPTLTK